MQTTMLRALLYSLAIPQCLAAVTWTPIGCDGWDFEGTGIDAIWDNAVELATQAQSQIDLIPKKFSMTGFSPEENIAGANAEMIFGVDFRKHRGLSDRGKTTMEAAKSRYGEVLSGFDGTLRDMDPNRAFLFCGSNGLVNTPIPGSPNGAKIWHAEVNLQGITEYITLSHVTSGSPEPCTETVRSGQHYQGKTFYAVLNRGERQERLTGIIICPNQYAAVNIPVRATLSNGYETQGRQGNRPYPGEYQSLSGTLVHEMVHVVGRFQYNTQWEDGDRNFQNYGFKAVHALARRDSDANLRNPDTFKVFAEMSQSPATEWGMVYVPPST